MATVRELVTLLGFKVDNAQLTKSEQRIDKLKTRLKQVGVAVAAGIVAIGIAAIKIAGDMESLTASFEVMLGNAERAKQLVEDLTAFSAKTPFQLKDISEGAKTLLQFGLEAEQLMPTLQMLGDVAGSNSQKFKQLTLVFGQIQSTGKLMGQDLLQLINAGFNPLTVLAKQSGKEVSVLKEEMSKGRISAEMVTEAFKIATSEGGMFFQNMLKQSQTLGGVWSTLKDNFIITLGQAANQVLPQIKQVLGALIPIIQNDFKPMLVELMKSLVPIFKTVITLLGSIIRLAIPIFRALSRIISSVFKLINALMPIIEVVLEIFLGFISIILNRLEKELTPLFNELAETISSLIPVLVPILKLFGKLSAMLLKLTVVLPFKIMAKSLTLVFKILNAIIPLIDRLFPSFELMINGLINIITLFEKIFDTISDGVLGTVDFIFKMLNQVIEAVNKLPFMEDKQIKLLDRDALEREMIKGGDQYTTRTNTFHMQNQFNIDGGIQNQQMMKKTMDKTAGTIFNIRLKELIIDAGGL